MNPDCSAMPPALLDALAAEAERNVEMLIVEGVMGLFDGAGVRAAAPARPRISPRGRHSGGAGARCRAASPAAAAVGRGLARMTRKCASPGSCSSRAAVNATTRWWPMLSRRSAFQYSARAAPRRALAAGTPPRAGPGRRTCRSRRADRPPRRHGRTAARPRRASWRWPRRSNITTWSNSRTGAAAARPAHRAGAGPRLQLRLSASACGVAPCRRGTAAVLAARRRTRRRITPIVAGCPAAMRSCTPTHSPRRGRFSSGLRRFAETRPVHGECGGYMVLGQSLEDATGKNHAMTGLLGHMTSFAKRKLHLGYRTAQEFFDSVLGRGGRGRARPRIPLRLADRGRRRRRLRRARRRRRPPLGQSGGRRGHVSGTFFHASPPLRDKHAQHSSSATVPRPPSAQMLTMARLPGAIAASSLTA